MDSGVIMFVPLLFIGGLMTAFVSGVLITKLRSWMAGLLGGLTPPTVLIAADLIENGLALEPDDVAAIATVWAIALVPAAAGAVCGVMLHLREQRRQQF